MTHEICDSCETVAHCRRFGCIPIQPAQPQPAVLRYDGLYEYAQANRLNYNELCMVVSASITFPPALQKPLTNEGHYTTTRNSWTGRATHKCNRCGRDDFRSEHSAKFHECKPAEPQQEPVAWMKPHPKCDSACLFQCTKGFTQFPECAAPQPAQQQEPFCEDEGCPHHGTKHICVTAAPKPAQRKPLPDEQIAAFRRDIVSQSGVFGSVEWCNLFARAIETAHNIKD